MGGWQILVQQGPRAGQAFDLDKPAMTIGREVGNDIVIEDPQVSRHHARLTQQGAGFVIEDLGSTNGTTVNGQRVTGSRPISPGDTLALGDTIVLKVTGAAGETIVAHGQPQTLVAPASPPPSPQSFSAPPPPPPPPMGYGAPPPPPQKKGLSCWIWGCGCIVVILIILLLALAWLYFLAPAGVTQPIIDFFRMFGINLV
jgi:hypothetical protein